LEGQSSVERPYLQIISYAKPVPVAARSKA